MTRLAALHISLLPRNVDPAVAPNWTFFPFMSWLRNAVGGGVAVVLILLVLVAVAGALTWAGSKFSGAQRMQSVSGTVTIVAFGAAILVGSASAIVKWAAGQNLGF